MKRTIFGRDVDFTDVEPHSSAITPVQGGVGPNDNCDADDNNCVETVRTVGGT